MHIELDSNGVTEVSHALSLGLPSQLLAGVGASKGETIRKILLRRLVYGLSTSEYQSSKDAKKQI